MPDTNCEPPSSDAAGEYRRTRYFPSLDGLRCLAILPVIWHHSTPRPLPGLLGKGPAGVDLFFCISGFLITTLLLRERAERGHVALPSFYKRRALRIFPLYFTVLIAYVAFACALPETAPQRAHFFRTLPYYATFTANWFGNFAVPHPILFAFAWSLCIEEQFYAFWPVCVARLSRLGAALLMVGVLLLDFLAERGVLGFALPSSSLSFRVLTSFAAPIGLGAILALILDSRRGFLALDALLGRVWSAPLALGLVVLTLADEGSPLWAFQASLALLVGASVIRPRHGLSFLLEARAVRHVGAVSYGAYLLNSTVVGLVHRAFPAEHESASFVFALTLPLTLLLATLSRRYWEAPFLRFGARFRNPAGRAGPAVMAR